MLALDDERQIHRQLQALEHAAQHRLRRRIVVVSFAPVDGVGGRPDHHARSREHLARRRLEFRIVPGRLGVRIGLHPGLGERDDLVGRRDLMDEAHFLRGRGTQLVALEQHLQRVRRRHQSRDALRAAAAGKKADLDFRQADPRLVAVGDDPVVAGERELEAAAHADAVDRRRDGFAAGLEAPEDQIQLLHGIDEAAHRRFFAFGFGATGEFVARSLEHRQIRSADAFAEADDRALDRRVARDLVDDLPDLGHDFGVDDVHRTAGHVPGDERDAVGVGLETKVGQFHGKSPSRDQTRSMIVAVPMPPPMQRVMSAVLLPVRSSSSSAVPRIMAPVAPSGWPMAMAPPLTLTLFGSTSNA